MMNAWFRSDLQHLFLARRVSALLALAAFVALTTGCPVVPPPNDGDDDDPPAGPIISVDPGLTVTVVSVEIPADGRPEVEFTATDDVGSPVPLSSLTDARFILAYLEDAAEGSLPRLLSYTTSIEDPDGVANSGDEATQATYDSARLNGVTQDEDGSFVYKFAKAVPPDYDASATHQLAGQFRRAFSIDGKNYYSNPVFDFRPDGAKDTLARDIVNTETCNECHTRLAFHGGGRREIQLCIMCHSTLTTDANSGNTVDFPEMIHKIHMGEELPSVQDGVPYQIVGHNDHVYDYSDVVFPQDIRRCETCHQGSAQSDVYLTTPTLAGCGSCHDRAWFGDPDMKPDGYENHIGGQQVDDRLCSLCHPATGPGSAPIMEAHIVPTDSAAAPGLAFDITEVRTTATKQGGATLEISFTLTDGAGAPVTDPFSLNRLRALVAYPATDYDTTFRENIGGSSNPDGVLVNNGDGSYEYTFATLLPVEPGMTYAVGMEGRVDFEFRGDTYRQGTSSNALTYFTVDGSEVVPRREVVENDRCNVCHYEIRFHGGSRYGVEYCVMCHNPYASGDGETINFKPLLHHAHDVDVKFPGDTRDCELCHIPGTQQVPLPDGVAPTVVTEDETEIVTLPTTSACISCHEGMAPALHATLNSDLEAGVESCEVCHGDDAAHGVELVHEIEP